jgi:hypothetical protein
MCLKSTRQAVAVLARPERLRRVPNLWLWTMPTESIEATGWV